MGVRTGALRLVVILCATLLTAASVAVSGMIGWVGLVIPHFCRMPVSYTHLDVYKRQLYFFSRSGAMPTRDSP